MIIIGLTGSVGMGKSTTAKLFAEEGAPVWDADQAVHRLYKKGGAGVAAVEALSPTSVKNGEVRRELLREAVMAQPELLKKIEAVIHPLVTEDRAAAIKKARADGAGVIICDVPLIFETGGEGEFDHIVVVSAPAEEQRRRVLERPGMDEASFEAILARQTPDEEKRRRADFIIETGAGIDEARKAVRAIIEGLKGGEDA